MQNTKSIITQTAINLFNAHGYKNVSLPHIADKMGISLGNLTYHFPKKIELMQSVYKKFQDDSAEVTKEYQTFPDLEDVYHQLKAFHKFQERFCFFYLDFLEIGRAYPTIAEQHQVQIATHIQGIYKYILFNVEIRNLKHYDNLAIYENLAQQLWMAIFFWPMQLIFRGKVNTVEKQLTAVWNLITPYLTNKGKKNLEQVIIANKKNWASIFKH